MVFVVLITAMLLIMYLYSKRWDRKLRKISSSSKTTKYTQSKIFGIVITGKILNMYILCLDVVAVVTLYHEDVDVPEKKLASVPYLVVAVTGIALIICGTFLVLSLCSLCHCCAKLKDMEFIFLSLSTLGPMFSVVIHLPYITIAFLNDAFHASSVFIFYTVVSFVLFGALELNYGTCQGALIDSKNGKLMADKIIIKNPTTLESPNQESLQNLEATICMTHRSKIKLEFLKVKQQNVNVQSIKLFPVEAQVQRCQTFLENLNEGMNITIQFQQSQAGPEMQPLCDVTCELKSLSDEDISEVQVQVQRNLTLPIKGVDRGSDTITFQDNSVLAISDGKLLKHSLHCCPTCTKSKNGIIVWFLLSIPAFVILLLALTVLISSVLVVIPINNSFSDTPDRVFGFYQTSLVLIGAYFFYKKLFKKKPSLEKVVREREKYIPSDQAGSDETWQHLSKDERVTAFYSRIVELVANYKEKPSEDEGGN